jgi:PPP family 3-phenylpropionic acid transporter
MAAVQTPAAGTSVKMKINVSRFHSVLSDSRFILFLVFGFLFFIPIISISSYFPILMDSVGGTKTQFGLAIFIGAMCEIPVYLSGKYLVRKIGPIRILLIAALLQGFRMFLFSLITEPIHIILIQFFGGSSLALYTMGYLYYLDEIAPSELKATYITIAVSTSAGMGGMVSGYLGGWIIENYNIRYLVLIGTAVSFISFSFFVLSESIRRCFSK